MILFFFSPVPTGPKIDIPILDSSLVFCNAGNFPVEVTTMWFFLTLP